MIRSSVTRRTVGVGAAMFALALGGASVAWACASIQPKVSSQGTSSGPAGSQITLTGRDFAPGRVEIRWNTLTGQMLGEALGPSFSVSVTIPNAAVGMHYILAVPSVGNRATMPFEVTAPARQGTGSSGATGSTGATTSAGEEDSTASNTSGNSSGVDNSTAGSSTTGSDGQTSTEGSASGSTTATSSSEQAKVATREPNTAATSSPRAASVGTPAPQRQSPAASANPAVVTTPAGQAVFGGSSAPSIEAPSTASVSGDTWSGFGASAKPSLLADEVTASESAPTSSASTVGVALLGGGLVALFAGFAAAESARKRAVAGAGAP